jgi:hypothetical protein
MEGEAISKIVEPKTGLINTEQALAIIGKESGGADKVALIRQGLGDNIPKKMDFNDFRKTVQDQLIPLEREFATHSSGYGIARLGYYAQGTVPKYSESYLNQEINKINSILEQQRLGKIKMPDSEVQGLNNKLNDYEKHLSGQSFPEYIENQTLILGNKNKFGRGSSAHNNPDETLGHAHFLRDAETPDVLTVTQIQSDAFQGTHRIMPDKSKKVPEFFNMKQEQQLKNLRKSLDEDKAILHKYSTNKVDDAGHTIHQSQIDQIAERVRIKEQDILFKEADAKNFTQKQLLDKNHQERYIQELVDYAGKRGDVNKMRVPTSETAAKVQGYSKVDPVTDPDKISKIKRQIEAGKKRAAEAPIEDKEKWERGVKSLQLELNGGYEFQHQTILKKYSEQPKTIKKLFGKEPTIVRDSKGNTWYEFDIPEKFKQGKGEIKAFGLAPIIGIGGAGTLGAASQIDKKKYGGMIKKYPLGGIMTTDPELPRSKSSYGFQTTDGLSTSEPYNRPPRNVNPFDRGILFDAYQIINNQINDEYTGSKYADIYRNYSDYDYNMGSKGEDSKIDCSGFICDSAKELGIDYRWPKISQIKANADKIGFKLDKDGEVPKDKDGKYITPGGAAQLAISSNALDNQYKNYKDLLDNKDKLEDRDLLFQAERNGKGIYHVVMVEKDDTGNIKLVEMTDDKKAKGVMRTDLETRAKQFRGGNAVFYHGKFPKKSLEEMGYTQQSKQSQFLKRAQASVGKKKYGGMIKKYPLGGIMDLFSGINQGDPMSAIQQFASTLNSTAPGGRSMSDLFGRAMNAGNTNALSYNNISSMLGLAGPEGQQMADKFGGIFGMMDQLQQFQNQPRDNFNPQNWTTNASRGMFQLGGEVQEPMQIQAERGEYAILPDNTITKVKAKKKHSQMSDDEVTDILPPESFVASDDKRMKFSKKELEKISFGYGPISYIEGETSAPPKEYTAADIMTRKNMKPAEYIKAIKNKYPTTGIEDDPFAMLADAENLQSRTPYVATMKYITESKKPPSQRQQMPQAQLGYVIPPTDYYNNLNFSPIRPQMYNRGGMIPKADMGWAMVADQLLGRVDNIAGGIAGMYATRQQRKATKKNYSTFLKEMGNIENIYREGADRQRGFLGAGTALGIAGDLMQDTDYTVPQLDTRYVDAMPQEMPRVAMDNARRDMRMANRAATSYATRNAPSFSRAANMLGMSQANQFNAIGNLAGQQAMNNLGLRTNYLQQRGALANQQNQLDAQGENMRRQASNQRVASITNRGVGYTQGLSGIDANMTNLEGGFKDRRMNTKMAYDQKLADLKGQQAYNIASLFMSGSEDENPSAGSAAYPTNFTLGSPLPTINPYFSYQQTSPAFGVSGYAYPNMPNFGAMNTQPFNPSMTGAPAYNPWGFNSAPRPVLGMWNYPG